LRLKDRSCHREGLLLLVFFHFLIHIVDRMTQMMVAL
jgi:hypothetical protein